MPSYLRIMDDPINRNVVHRQASGEPAEMLQIISRNKGWITIDPSHPGRKSLENKSSLVDASQVNKLSPQWMQVQFKKPLADPLTQTTAQNGLNYETNRTFLVEKQ
jgi:hypothetical protein